jgi:hypothetical protein
MRHCYEVPYSRPHRPSYCQEINLVQPIGRFLSTAKQLFRNFFVRQRRDRCVPSFRSVPVTNSSRRVDHPETNSNDLDNQHPSWDNSDHTVAPNETSTLCHAVQCNSNSAIDHDKRQRICRVLVGTSANIVQ